VYLQSIKSVEQNACLLTGQLKEKPTYRVWCLYSSFVHAVLFTLLLHSFSCPVLGGVVLGFPLKNIQQIQKFANLFDHLQLCHIYTAQFLLIVVWLYPCTLLLLLSLKIRVFKYCIRAKIK
jgi:hypothetical protein